MSLRILTAIAGLVALLTVVPATAVADIEPNDGIHQPEGPLLAGTYVGDFDSSNDQDWYSFYAGPGLITISLTNIDDATDCRVTGNWRNANGLGPLSYSEVSFSAYENATDSETYTLTKAERFLFSVTGSMCTGNQYSLKLEGAIVAGPPLPAAVPTPDTNQIISQAFGPLSGDVRYTGRTDSANDEDWFYFHTAAATPVTVTMLNSGDPTACSAKMTLRDAASDYLDDVNPSNNTGRAMSIAAPGPRTYYLVHSGTCAGNEYEFTLSPASAFTSTAPPPDRDGDNVPDASDQCPDTAGVAPSGCADRDRDGVPDSSDQCKDTAGPGPSGCPDSDGDGIIDAADRCPSTAGVAPNGCRERVRYASTITLKRKGRTYRGRLTSPGQACVYRRKIVLRRVGKGTRSYGTAFTRSDGTFTIRAKKGARGRMYVIAKERTTAASLCRVGRSSGLRV